MSGLVTPANHRGATGIVAPGLPARTASRHVPGRRICETRDPGTASCSRRVGRKKQEIPFFPRSLSSNLIRSVLVTFCNKVRGKRAHIFGGNFDGHGKTVDGDYLYR
jgi:hypothetical protein